MSDTDYLLRKVAILSRALIASGVINIAVLTLMSYWLIRERPPTPYCELKPKKQEQSFVVIQPTGWKNQLAQLASLSLPRLIDRLTSSSLVGNAYQEREVALACLIGLHYFDIQRALKPQDLPLQKHVVKWTLKSGEIVHLDLYSNLTKQEWNAIIHFATTEQWPMTAQGLFSLLQKQAVGQHINPTLLEAFTMTSEFWFMELLLTRADPSLAKTKIASLLLEGNWQILKQFADQQREEYDLSNAKRRKILLEYLYVNSPTAAELLLKVDEDFVLKKLGEPQILAILRLLPKNMSKGELFAKNLLTGPWGEQVWQAAANYLYLFAGEKAPPVWDYQRTITRFISPSTSSSLPFVPAKLVVSTKNIKEPAPLLVKLEKEASLPQPSAARYYTVQKGDSLWKISQKFNISIEKIKSANQLKSDAIKPGLVLKIPYS